MRNNKLIRDLLSSNGDKLVDQEFVDNLSYLIQLENGLIKAYGKIYSSLK